MSRWFAMLDKLSAAHAPVQHVQFVQNNSKAPSFEHSEQFEQKAEEKPSAPSPAFDQEAFEERAAIIEGNGIPREWAEGFAALCTMPRPAAYPIKRWEQLVNDSGYFLDNWGRQAAALGWRVEDAFGVNPDAPEWRYEGMGLVFLLEGRSILAMSSNSASISCGAGVQQTFMRRKGTESVIPIWETKGGVEA